MKQSSGPVRRKALAHLDELVAKPEFVMVINHSNIASSCFKAAAGGLEEACNEARTHAQRIVYMLRCRLPSAKRWAQLLSSAGDAARHTLVQEVLQLSALPAAPTHLAAAVEAVAGKRARNDYHARVGSGCAVMRLGHAEQTDAPLHAGVPQEMPALNPTHSDLGWAPELPEHANVAGADGVQREKDGCRRRLPFLGLVRLLKRVAVCGAVHD